MTTPDTGMGRVDVGSLFEQYESILETHSISGAKVLHLLVQAAGLRETTWEESQAAHGLGLAFCYMRGQYATVFSSNMDLPQRAGPLLGCRLAATWTADAEEAWGFIKAGLRAGRPVKMAGPEDSVVYACVDAADAAGRHVEARGVGGPALAGVVQWEALAEWVKRWVPLPGGGMYRVDELTAKLPPAEAVKVLAQRVVDWQENHPGVGRCGDASNYGVSALELFLADLLEPDVEIPSEYINCFAMNFQHNARTGLSRYMSETASKLEGRSAALVEDLAGNYDASAQYLRQFVEEKLGENRDTPAGCKAIRDCLTGALAAEKRILDMMEELAGG